MEKADKKLCITILASLFLAASIGMVIVKILGLDGLAFLLVYFSLVGIIALAISPKVFDVFFWGKAFNRSAK